MANELKISLLMEEIVNESFCVSIVREKNKPAASLLTDNEILSSLKNKVGLYHLWIDQDYCADHLDHQMLCVYVGKGFAHSRIKSHLEKKWHTDERLFITFYECPNRIAKYLEQLFLDTHDFYLNTQENGGTKYFHTMWPDDRVTNGTQLHEQADILAKKYPDIYNPEE